MTNRARSSNRKPTPAPHPAPEPAAESPTSPLFLQPPEDQAEPMPAATMTEDSSPLPPSSSSSPNADAGAVSASPFGTPSTADPSAKPAPKKLTRAALRGYATKAVAFAGGLVAAALTKPDTIERAAGLWVPDEDDVRDISDPVAGLVSRRMPSKVAGAMNPDVEDAFVLALALAAYIGKQIQRAAELRAAYADLPTPDMTEPEGVAV